MHITLGGGTPTTSTVNGTTYYRMVTVERVGDFNCTTTYTGDKRVCSVDSLSKVFTITYTVDVSYTLMIYNYSGTAWDALLTLYFYDLAENVVSTETFYSGSFSVDVTSHSLRTLSLNPDTYTLSQKAYTCELVATYTINGETVNVGSMTDTTSWSGTNGTASFSGSFKYG